MICLSPKISNTSLSEESETGVQFSYGLQLDNVYLDRTKEKKEVFTVYPDPIFDDPNERSYQSKQDNYLTINVSSPWVL